MAQKTGGQDAGIVHHKAVTGTKIVDNVIKMFMAHFPALFVQDHEPGCVPLLQWSLGNQFFRKVIPKIMGFHRKSSVF
jgi:hypothetical protein